MKLRDFISNNQGIAIIAVTMILVVAALLGGAMVSQTTQDVQLANRTMSDKQALYLAESAKERAYQVVKDGGLTVTGKSRFVMATQPGETQPGTLTNQSILAGAGTYDLSVSEAVAGAPGSPYIIQIVGVGDSGRGRRRQITVVTEVNRENVCVWNNAIFGGSGYTGGVINGNCAIHGSVHLIGDGVGEGGTAIQALDLSGTALIHNNYDGMDAVLQPKVPALPTNDAGLGTLSAKLRVKNGAVGVSGNSEIGQDPGTTTAKGPLDGIYIETDPTQTRWTGTSVDADGVPDPTKVFSDNGVDNLYDLGDEVQMPTLSDPYLDTWTDTTFSSYDDYFANNVDNRSLGGNRPGHSLQLDLASSNPTLTLDGSTSAVIALQAAAPAGSLVTPYGVSGIKITDAYGNSIAYDPTAGSKQASLAINGMVQIQGDLQVGSSTGTYAADVEYSGRGTVYVSGNGSNADGDVTIDANLLPATTFPTGDVLGLVASNSLYLGAGSGGAQLLMAGAFYAETQVVSRKQTQVCGTFVCNYFDMGTNIPRIFQVPTLTENLPPGIIGGDPIWVITGFEEKSWRTDFEPTGP